MDESFYFFLGGECVGPQNLVKHYVASSHNRLVLPEEKKNKHTKWNTNFQLFLLLLKKEFWLVSHRILGVSLNHSLEGGNVSSRICNKILKFSSWERCIRISSSIIKTVPFFFLLLWKPLIPRRWKKKKDFKQIVSVTCSLRVFVTPVHSGWLIYELFDQRGNYIYIFFFSFSWLHF